MSSRSIHSPGALARPAALTLAALVMLLPAYALPVMYLGTAGEPPVEATVLYGIVLLARQDLWGLAAIVFTASVLVPILKLAGMAVLLASIRKPDASRARRLTRIYATIEWIGRWSMLDVFLVAFLAGAVRFGTLAVVEPRAGIIAFAAVVVLTMLATRTFDPRILWSPNPSSQPVR